MYKHKKEISRY